MKTRLAIGLLIWLLAFGVLVAGCGDDDDDDNDTDTADDDDAGDDDVLDDDYTGGDDDSEGAGCNEAPASANEHTLLGLQYLSVPAGGAAHAEFLQALAQSPNDQDALMGIILADASSTFDAISVIKLYLDYILGDYEPAKAARDGEDNLQYYLDDLLNELLGSLFIQQADEIGDYVDQALELECPSLELAELPVVIDFETIATVGGNDWDASEMLASRAVVQSLGGVIRLMDAINFNVDLTYLLGLADIDFGSFSTIEVVSIIVDILDRVLNDPSYPDFLTMNGNEDAFLQAQLDLGLGLRSGEKTFVEIRSETDPQYDDILAYRDVNMNDLFDEFDHYNIPPWGDLDEGGQALALEFEALFGDAADSFLDNTAYDANPDTPDPFDLASLNAVLKAAGLPGILPHLDIELNSMFEGSDPAGFRDTLRTIVNALQLLLPAPPDY